MSGQPLRHPNDATKFRKAYLATLNLQQEINKKNFDANALYKRTGVVPTEITDYRSTSEKIADLVNLRIMIRAQLRQIADAPNAEDIAQSLSADQLVFLSQHIDAIIKDLRPKNKFGVLKDIFMKYLENYMMKERANQLASVGLPDTTRPFRSAPEVPLERQTKRLTGLLGDVQRFIESVRTEENKSIIANISQGLGAINFLNAVDLSMPLSLMGNPDDKSRAEMLLDQAREPLPTIADVEQHLETMKQFQGDPDYLNELLAQLAGRLTFDPTFFELRNEAEQLITASIARERAEFKPSTEDELYAEIEDERQTDVPTTVNSSIVSRTDPADWKLENPLPSLFVKRTDEENLAYYKTFGNQGQKLEGRKLADLRALINSIMSSNYLCIY